MNAGPKATIFLRKRRYRIVVAHDQPETRMPLLDRAVRLIASIVIALSVSAASALAGAPFSFADTPGKLPKTVVPVHYALDLKPDLDRLTVTGSEVVEIDVKAPTDRLLLNT